MKLRDSVAPPADLETVAPIQAAMAEEESGTNPLATDPEGFLARCPRRIEMGRVWLLEEDGKLMFKADIQADTPDVVYLEGVWVNPSERAKVSEVNVCDNFASNFCLVQSRSVCWLTKITSVLTRSAACAISRCVGSTIQSSWRRLIAEPPTLTDPGVNAVTENPADSRSWWNFPFARLSSSAVY